MQGYGGKSMALLSLHSDSYWRRAIRFTSRLLIPGKKTNLCQLNIILCGYQIAGLGALEECGQIHVLAAYSGERDKRMPIEYYIVWVPDCRSGRFKGENSLPSQTSNPGPGSP